MPILLVILVKSRERVCVFSRGKGGGGRTPAYVFQFVLNIYINMIQTPCVNNCGTYSRPPRGLQLYMMHSSRAASAPICACHARSTWRRRSTDMVRVHFFVVEVSPPFFRNRRVYYSQRELSTSGRRTQSHPITNIHN